MNDSTTSKTRENVSKLALLPSDRTIDDILRYSASMKVQRTKSLGKLLIAGN